VRPRRPATHAAYHHPRPTMPPARLTVWPCERPDWNSAPQRPVAWWLVRVTARAPGEDPACVAVVVVHALAERRGSRTCLRPLDARMTALGWRLVSLPNQEVPHACTSR